MLGSESDNSGRVILHGQTVCEEGFDDNAANVVCKMLGFQYGEAVMGGLDHDDNLELAGKSFNCTGKETSLESCNILTGVSCDSNKDAAVLCEEAAARQNFPGETGTIFLS